LLGGDVDDIRGPEPEGHFVEVAAAVKTIASTLLGSIQAGRIARADEGQKKRKHGRVSIETERPNDSVATWKESGQRCVIITSNER
jgi:hypothetical protein